MPASSQSLERGPAVNALVTLIEKSLRGMDQKLGYLGRDRFVLFYYEPRGEEVIWRDCHSYGFATGAAQLFIDELGPVANYHHVDVGVNGSPGTHVLFIDRAEKRSYFVERKEAVQFMSGMAARPRESGNTLLGEAPPCAPTTTWVEITQESIAKHAYLIWEQHGRLEGKELDHWLQAEANLRKSRELPRKLQ